jgi:hypothetical protein
MKLNHIQKILLTGLVICLSSLSGLQGQPVPGVDENIPFLVTFGKDGDKSWGDPNFSQTFYFAVPKDFKDRFYIRVFDPDTGGENDEQKGEWNTKMQYTVFGGKGVDPDVNRDTRGITPTGNYKSGNILQTRTFGIDPQYDNNWYTFGPFIATQGDFSLKWNMYIFKIICGGISGDDGNLYKYFLSHDPKINLPIEGSKAFTYAYTFRMWNDIKSVSHIYPYIDTGIVYVREKNFDWDDDGRILVVSKVRRGLELKVSGQKEWTDDKIPVESGEIGSSLDFQFHKKQEFLIRNNNVLIQLENQRGDGIEVYPAPIGGVPVYQVDAVVKPVKRK